MNDDFLNDLILVAKAMDAPPNEPSERAKELFEAALARRQPFEIVSEKQMRVIILQLLTKGRFDGGQIIEKLNELKYRMNLEGEGVIYGLLARMEEESLVIGKFDEAMVRKIYRIDEPKGTKLLEKSSALARASQPRIDALPAT